MRKSVKEKIFCRFQAGNWIKPSFSTCRETSISRTHRPFEKPSCARCVKNLSKVRYIDSSGVASLVEGLRASRDVGSRLILFGLSTSAREVLQLSRLLKIFEIYDNEEQALAG